MDPLSSETAIEAREPARASSPTKRAAIGDLGAFVLLTILATLAYSNSLSAPFVFDDHFIITRSQGMRSLDSALEAQTSRRFGFVSFALNYEAHGLWLPGYHLVNVAIHLVAACFLYLLVKQVLLNCSNMPVWQGSSGKLALLSASIWLVHPLQTASVTYVIQRFESLMGMFLLASLYTLLRAHTTQRNVWLWQVLSVAAYLAAVFTKEVALVFPFVALAFDRVFLAGTWRAVWLKRGLVHGSLLGLAGAALYMSRSLLDPHSGLSAGLGVKTISCWEYLRTQPEVLLHYLRLCIWPDQLCLDYAWPVATSPWRIYPLGLVILGLLGLTVWSLWRFPRVGFLGLAFFVLLAPTSSFVPLLDLAFEHRMYLPLACVVVFTVLAGASVLEKWAAHIPQNRGLRWGVSIALLVVLSARTVSRNEDYRDATRMWRTVVAANPNSYRAHLMLGASLTAAGLLEEAEQHFRHSIRLKPTILEAWINLGHIRVRQGRWDEAEYYIRHGLLDKRTVPLAKLNLANLEEKRERISNAFALYREAATSDPALLKAWVEYARLAERLENDREAVLALRHLWELDPLLPDVPSRLAIILAKSKDPDVRDPASAIRIAESKCRQTRRTDRLALEALAISQWANGDGRAALGSLDQALGCSGNAASRQRIINLRNEINSVAGRMSSLRVSTQTDGRVVR